MPLRHDALVCDVVLFERKDRHEDDALMLTFSVRQSCEQSLDETLLRAKASVETKDYASDLVKRGIEKDRIHTFGIVFDHKQVLIG